MMREIVFDTETTGLDPKTGDRLVEIGCVELMNRVETGVTFQAYYNPERDMPAAAQAVHGLSNAFLSAKPLFRDEVHELLDFLGDAPLIAHNAEFDFGFLNAELTLCGLDPIPMERMVDTLALARKRHPRAKLSLDALCTRYGIDRSHRIKHGALLDAELLTQVYVELLGGRQIGLELAQDSGVASAAQAVVEGLQASPVGHVTRPSVPQARQRLVGAARNHQASAEELARHKEFIQKITAPLWER